MVTLFLDTYRQEEGHHQDVEEVDLIGMAIEIVQEDLTPMCQMVVDEAEERTLIYLPEIDPDLHQDPHQDLQEDTNIFVY